MNLRECDTVHGDCDLNKYTTLSDKKRLVVLIAPNLPSCIGAVLAQLLHSKGPAQVAKAVFLFYMLATINARELCKYIAIHIGLLIF